MLTKADQLKYIKQHDRQVRGLEKKAHALWRAIVFARAKGKCEYPGCHREATQPHHIFTKGHSRHLRLDTENGMALCYTHHKGGNEAAHCDINFKDKILGRKYGYKAVRTEAWFDKLERKAACPYKLDVILEYQYLLNEAKKYEIHPEVLR